MSNVWKQLENLFPKKKYIIGTVNSIDSTHFTSNVTLISGETLTVKGTSVSVGNTVLIENGVIIQQLQTFSSYNVTVY